MRKALAAFYRFIAKPVATFFAILFVLTSSLVIPLINVERILLDAGTYKHALSDNDVYQKLPNLAKGEIEALKTSLSDSSKINSEDLDFLNNLTSEEWQTLVTRLLPPEEARGMVENLLDQVFANLSGATDDAVLSLTTLKAHLAGPEGIAAIQALLEAQPACTEEQVAQIHTRITGDTSQPAGCNPPQQDLSLLTSQWQARVESTADKIPDDVILKPPFGPANEGSPGNSPLARLNTLRMAIWFSPILPLILLGLLTLFMVRSFNDWLRWWGIPFFVTGLIVAAIGLAIRPLLNWVLVNFLLPQFPSTFSVGITSLVRSLVGSVARALATPITLEAVIIGLLGLAATIGSYFIKTSLKEPVPLAPGDAE